MIRKKNDMFVICVLLVSGPRGGGGGRRRGKLRFKKIQELTFFIFLLCNWFRNERQDISFWFRNYVLNGGVSKRFKVFKNLLSYFLATLVIPVTRVSMGGG